MAEVVRDYIRQPSASIRASIVTLDAMFPGWDDKSPQCAAKTLWRILQVYANVIRAENSFEDDRLYCLNLGAEYLEEFCYG